MDQAQQINQRINQLTEEAIDRLMDQIGSEFDVEIQLYEEDREQWHKLADAEGSINDVMMTYVVRHRPIAQQEAQVLHREIANGLR